MRRYRLGVVRMSRIARFAACLLALAIVCAGCGGNEVGSGNGRATTSTANASINAGGPTGNGTVRPEPNGPETPQARTDRGLAITLGGPPSGRGGASGGFYRFSAQQPTWCVPVVSASNPPLSSIPQGMSIAVTVTVQSRPPNAFVASGSSRCNNPCDDFTFTTPHWQCDFGVTWNGQLESNGYLAVTLVAYCGTANQSDCKKWASTNYNPDGVDMAAHGTPVATTSTSTTSPGPTTSTSTTTTSQVPSTRTSTVPSSMG